MCLTALSEPCPSHTFNCLVICFVFMTELLCLSHQECVYVTICELFPKPCHAHWHPCVCVSVARSNRVARETNRRSSKLSRRANERWRPKAGYELLLTPSSFHKLTSELEVPCFHVCFFLSYLSSFIMTESSIITLSSPIHY